MNIKDLLFPAALTFLIIMAFRFFFDKNVDEPNAAQQSAQVYTVSHENPDITGPRTIDIDFIRAVLT